MGWFNTLKKEYQTRNIFTFEDLIKQFKTNPKVTINTVIEDNFCDWEFLLDLLYVQITDLKKCHIFSADTNDAKKMILKVDNLQTFPKEIKDLFRRDPVNKPRKSDIL